MFKHLASNPYNSNGRLYNEPDDDLRNPFERDRARVIHSNSFRKLKHKTQVFIESESDYFRTRLTHSLEVAQISRSICRLLELNEDLGETVALAHDLGHPPFGHAGEDALDEILQEFNMNFEHNKQSLRVVEKLEKAYPNFEGLNLCNEVLEGLIKHQTAYDQAGEEFEIAAHLEAQVVNIADEIAYTSHDIDDGLRSKLVSFEEIEKIKLWKLAKNETEKQFGSIKEKDIFVARVSSKIVGILIDDLLSNTSKKIQNIKSLADYKGSVITFSEDMKINLIEVHEFLLKNFYLHPEILKLTDEGKNMIKKLFKFYLDNPDKLPRKDKSITSIKDYIAGMTDNFLIKEYSKI